MNKHVFYVCGSETTGALFKDEQGTGYRTTDTLSMKMAVKVLVCSVSQADEPL